MGNTEQTHYESDASGDHLLHPLSICLADTPATLGLFNNREIHLLGGHWCLVPSLPHGESSVYTDVQNSLTTCFLCFWSTWHFISSRDQWEK